MENKIFGEEPVIIVSFRVFQFSQSVRLQVKCNIMQFSPLKYISHSEIHENQTLILVTVQTVSITMDNIDFVFQWRLHCYNR
jgi:hypothetical protein